MNLEFFSHLCTVHADTSRVVKQKQQGPNGPYYVQEYDIVLLYGLTETRAQIRWIQDVSTIVFVNVMLTNSMMVVV